MAISINLIRQQIESYIETYIIGFASITAVSISTQTIQNTDDINNLRETLNKFYYEHHIHRALT